ncbi:MAG: response regulator [Candidatus Abyssobacteria bacterium SURF_5]|jgi:DNA-binding response OmpR family regulator|uniref:Response regulator n=1 Tax=Abyssobacteria bacterium (strain SURF_5) TaxID=2093360 RepID=A0A3A4P4W5_ABYX5|nr:MAG: response regulator [Candidatus Abyssubacteria bacterium SURF_5]
MKKNPILVVDDEKNIRTTLRQALESAGYRVETAVSGEDALAKLAESSFDLLFLDIKLPGIDGLEVLRRLRAEGKRLPVIIITAYGTIESAVDAMKMGAVDYLRKPFAPDQIRDMASTVLSRPELKEHELETYDQLLEYSKMWINELDVGKAAEFLQKAIGADSSRPEAFNLLGIILELKGNLLEAQKRYRAAIALDPTFEPAHHNLSRVTELDYTRKGIDFGPEPHKEDDGKEKKS